MRKLLNLELNRKTLEQFRNTKKAPFIIVLDNVRSQSNVGSIFRTADAFLTEAIYLCGITSTPLTGRYRKLPWEPQHQCRGNIFLKLQMQ